MSCNHFNHSYLCNCDKTGIVIPITIDKTKCIEYDNLYAMPMDKDMIDEFNGYVEKAGGLENACIKYPYVVPYVDRYGLMHTPDADFSCYTNLFHIILKKNKDNAWKTVKKGPAYNPLTQERFSNGLYYKAPIENVNTTSNDKNIEFSKFYDFKQEPKKETISPINLKVTENIKQVKYSFDAKKTINGCNNPKKGNQTFLKYHPNDPRFDEQNRNFMNRPAPQWQGSNTQPPMWQKQPIQYPSWNNVLGTTPQYNQQQPITPALELEQQALAEQTSPKVTVGGRDMTREIIGTPSIQPNNLNIFRPNNSMFSKEDYINAENQINQSINDESWMAENEFPSEEEACYQQPQQFNPWMNQHSVPNYTQQQYESPYNRFMYSSYMNVDELGLPTRYIPQRNNRWMKPTREEIKSGKVPLVGVCINGKETANVEEIIKANEELEKINKIKYESVNSKPKVAIVTIHTEENGLQWQEFVKGDKDIIITKEKAIAQETFKDYKMGSINSAVKKQQEDTYNLAKELRRYNQELADNLLWYQSNVNFDEFIEMKRECQNQLIEYRNNDPVSSAKSSVIIAGDTTLIKEPRPLTDNQLKDMRNKFNIGKKDDELIENTIKKYSIDDIKFDSQDKTIFSNDNIDNKIEKLQNITNLKVIPLDKDKAHVKMNSAIKTLSPIKVTQKDRYVLWKKLIRGSMVISNQNMDNFDKDFDTWWNKPRIQNRDEFNEKYLERMYQLYYEHLAIISMSQPTQEQIKSYNESIIAKQWRDFDQGSCKKDMSTYQFMKNLGFLETRMIEQEIQQQRYQLRRRYDPEAYKALSREYSAKQNYLDGKGYVATVDLMDQKLYNKKRQLFIDQIFKKAHRGTIT